MADQLLIKYVFALVAIQVLSLCYFGGLRAGQKGRVDPKGLEQELKRLDERLSPHPGAKHVAKPTERQGEEEHPAPGPGTGKGSDPPGTPPVPAPKPPDSGADSGANPPSTPAYLRSKQARAKRGGGGGEEEVGPKGDDSAPTKLVALKNAGVVVMAFNRPDYLKQSVESILDAKLAPHIHKYVSQDGSDPATAQAARSFEEQGVKYFSHERASPTGVDPRRKTGSTAALAMHYKWILDKVFFEEKRTHVIIVEDDIVVSPDFFQYFEQTAPLLDEDPSIWCISSWNDHGFAKGLEFPAKKLFRNSYFPGLGWMLRAELWAELNQKFPTDHWDHWMRVPSVSKGRDCICPYLSRNHNIGVHGVNIGKKDFSDFLANTKFSRRANIDLGDLSYLKKDAYRKSLEERLKDARAVVNAPSISAELVRQRDGDKPLAIYFLREDYKGIVSKQLGLMSIQRCHYKYVTVLQTITGLEVLLVDARRSELTPAGYKRLPNPKLEKVVADKPNFSCHDVCKEKNMRCDKDQFDFVNTCDSLQSQFRCERCESDMGKDIPNFVVDPNDRHFGSCLVTEEIPSCDAKHPATRRLCPCVA